MGPFLIHSESCVLQGVHSACLHKTRPPPSELLSQAQVIRDFSRSLGCAETDPGQSGTGTSEEEF